MTFMSMIRDTVEIWFWIKLDLNAQNVHFFTREQKSITVQNFILYKFLARLD